MKMASIFTDTKLLSNHERISVSKLMQSLYIYILTMFVTYYTTANITTWAYILENSFGVKIIMLTPKSYENRLVIDKSMTARDNEREEGI